MDEQLRKELLKAIVASPFRKKFTLHFESALIYGRSDLRLATDSECQICKEQDAQHET